MYLQEFKKLAYKDLFIGTCIVNNQIPPYNLLLKFGAILMTLLYKI